MFIGSKYRKNILFAFENEITGYCNQFSGAGVVELTDDGSSSVIDQPIYCSKIVTSKAAQECMFTLDGNFGTTNAMRVPKSVRSSEDLLYLGPPDRTRKYRAYKKMFVLRKGSL